MLECNSWLDHTQPPVTPQERSSPTSRQTSKCRPVAMALAGGRSPPCPANLVVDLGEAPANLTRLVDHVAWRVPPALAVVLEVSLPIDHPMETWSRE